MKTLLQFPLLDLNLEKYFHALLDNKSFYALVCEHVFGRRS